MRDEVDAGTEERLRVVEVEDVGRDAQAVLVRLIDHGRRRLERHLGRRAEVVVDANLDEIRFHRGDAIDFLARGLGRGRVDHRAGDKEARAIERGRRLRVAKLEPGLSVAPEAHDRRDPVARVAAELIEQVGLGVELRARLQPARVADVAVRVDHPRHHRPAGEIDDRVAGMNLNGAIPNRRDAPVAAHADVTARRDDPAVAIDDPRVVEPDRAHRAGRCLLARRASRRGHEQQHDDQRGGLPAGQRKDGMSMRTI